MSGHPHDLDLVAWLDGKTRGTPNHALLTNHIVTCKECAGLLLCAGGDPAFELLRTSWRELVGGNDRIGPSATNG